MELFDYLTVSKKMTYLIELLVTRSNTGNYLTVYKKWS